MIRFEQTFMDFLLRHQERHHRTYHFVILMDALISATKTYWNGQKIRSLNEPPVSEATGDL